MNASAHTPGPWLLAHDIVYFDDTLRSGNSHYGICEVTSNYPNWQDDARLIAAAPDLLQSCRELVEGLGFAVQGELTAKLIERAQAAIAKAEGKV